ncbi:MAG: PAS domain S-box protein [Chloroflexota bacterium]
MSSNRRPEQEPHNQQDSSPDSGAHEAVLQRFFYLSTEMMCIASVDGYILRANPAFCRHLGYDEATLRGSPFLSLVLPEDHVPTRSAMLRLQANETVTYFENRYICADGRLIWLAWQSTPDNDGRVYAVARDITERKQREADAAQESARLQAVLENIGDAFFALDADWRFTYINKKAERLLFRRAEDLLRKLVWDEFPEAVGSTFQQQYQQVMTHRVPGVFTEYYPPLDTWFEVTAYPAADGIAVYFRNINEIKEAEESQEVLSQQLNMRTTELSDTIRLLERESADRRELAARLRLAQAELACVIDLSAEAIIIVDEQFIIRRFSHGAEAIFGYSSAEVTGKQVTILTAPEQRDRHAASIRRLINAEEAAVFDGHRQSLVQGKDGQVFPVEMAIARLDLEGDTRYVLVVQDLRAQQQLDKAAHTVDSLKDELERQREINTTRSQFMSILSHEFRTPLATILSSIGLLEDYADRLNSERKAYHFGKIKAQINHLVGLMEDVLLIGKAESGTLNVDYEPVDVQGFIRELVDEIGNIYSAHRFEVGNFEDKVTAMLDRRLLRQAISNLLTNAAKYSPEGSVVLVTMQADDSAMTIKVQDQGVGIPAGEQQHIFEPFRRASNVGSTRGTGLGLAIVRQAIDLHGGDLHLHSTVGRGTTVTVLLPYTPRGRAKDAPQFNGGRDRGPHDELRAHPFHMPRRPTNGSADSRGKPNCH